MTTFAYDLFFPMPRPSEIRQGRKQPMLDYIMGETPAQRFYCVAFRGEIEAPTAEAALNAIFKRHNVGDDESGDRPNATTQRSMCVGDVVLMNDGIGSHLVFACAPMGWDMLHETRNLFQGVDLAEVAAMYAEGEVL
jgi:hypothetical protein